MNEKNSLGLNSCFKDFKDPYKLFESWLSEAKKTEINDLGNICHEHIEFYSLKSLKYLFENNGMEIFRIEENDINGGSYHHLENLQG